MLNWRVLAKMLNLSSKLCVAHGGALKSREDIAKRARKTGHTFPAQFCRAIDRLEKDDYTTELWIDFKNGVLTLRWSRKGVGYHTTVRGLNHIYSNLELLGKNGLMWCRARECGTGTEHNYAVRE